MTTAAQVDRAILGIYAETPSKGMLSPAIDDGSDAGRKWAALIKAIGACVPTYYWQYKEAMEERYEGRVSGARRCGCMVDDIARMPSLRRFVVQRENGLRGLDYAGMIAFIYADPRQPNELREWIVEALGL
jgi:hypothetical protein